MENLFFFPTTVSPAIFDKESSCHLWILKGVGDLPDLPGSFFKQPPGKLWLKSYCHWLLVCRSWRMVWLSQQTGFYFHTCRGTKEEGWGKDICLAQFLGFSWASRKHQWALKKNQWVPVHLFALVQALLSRTKNQTLPMPPFLLDFKD